uniref:hypothetical protein n=1 Tax=Gibbsiella quercinecans TaxID=929813 RepID=UPI002430E30B
MDKVQGTLEKGIERGNGLKEKISRLRPALADKDKTEPPRKSEWFASTLTRASKLALLYIYRRLEQLMAFAAGIGQRGAGI